MGAVYLAEHDRIGRRDAIKVLNRDLSDDESARARFTREARNASFINHPNVCTVYDFGETGGGLPFIAMEYVEGETLTDVLEREGPLAPRRAGELVGQVTRALEAAHARDIVHRDLKPDNVMLARDARGSQIVKVVDFGIAKAMAAEDDDGGQDITRQGLVVGTPQYVSPEQLEGKDLDGRSDLYSLGVVLFRILTGRLPFTGETWQEVMTKRLSVDPLTLTEAAPERRFSGALERVIVRALRRQPEDRYQEAADFREDLLRAVTPAGGDVSGEPAAPSGGGRGETAAGSVSGGRESAGSVSRADARGGDGGEVPATEVNPGASTSGESAIELPDLPWKTVGLATAGAAAVAALVFAGLRLTGGGDGAPSGVGEEGSAPVAAVGAADSGSSAGVEGAGAAEADTAEPGDRSTGSDDPSGESTTETGSPDGPGGEESPDAPGETDEGRTGPLAASEVEATLMRQFDALAPPLPGPDRLRAIGDTGRAIWSMEDVADDQRAWAAHIAGVAFLGRGDTLDACPWLQRAVELDPGGQGYRAQLEAVPPCGEGP